MKLSYTDSKHKKELNLISFFNLWVIEQLINERCNLLVYEKNKTEIFSCFYKAIIFQ